MEKLVEQQVIIIDVSGGLYDRLGNAVAASFEQKVRRRAPWLLTA